MMEVWTLGGGEYLVNVFNAVAAWTGGGGYRAMLQVVFVMGLAYSLFVVAFSLDWRAWLNWFIQATAIYMMLLVPTVTVKVTDRIDPGLSPAVVANVPLGLGVMASFTSQLGDWMTETAETVFVMPVALQMNNKGVIYGARLMEKAQTFEITDPVFAANLDEHFKQCVFYDILLGLKDMRDITSSNSIWTAIGPGSGARAQKWIERTGGSATSSSIVRCDIAYQDLNKQWVSEIDTSLLPFARATYPKLAEAAAIARLKNEIPQVAAAMHGTSTDPYAYLQQVSTMSAFMAARESFSDAAWDAYAAQRADAQSRNTYTSIAQQAMTWVPLLGIVLQVVFYAMFPVIFPLFLFPRTGLTTLRGYATGFFYLASWGPLYVILHMFVMNRAASSYAAVAPQGMTLMVGNGIEAVNNDIATVAGFLMMSVPFLAAGMARGAMAIAGHATSMLAPAQSAAEAAANERLTGNYAYGNTSFQNLTSNMQQSNKWDDRAAYASGYASGSFTESSGVVTSSFADGSNAYNAGGAISSFATTPTQTSSFDQRVSQTQAQGLANVERLSRNESESWSAVASRGTELMQTAERRTSSGIESGSGLSTSLSQMNTVSQNLTSKLSNTFGFTAAESRELATISQTTGSVDAGLSALADKWGIKGKGELGVKLASIINENTGRRVSADQAYDEVRDFASSEINSTEARSARDSFNRETSSLTNSRGENLTERLGSTISHANDVSRQASQVEEAYNRFSRDFQVTEGAGYSVTDNDSQKFAEFVQERMLSDSLLGHYGSIPQILHPATPDQRQVRDILLGEFVQQKHEDLAEARRAMGIADPAPMERTLAAPPISTAEGIRGFGEKNRSAVRGEAPEVIVRSNSNDPSVGAEVAGRLEAGERRVAAGATALADQHDAADRRAANLTTSVSEREEGSMLGNIPYVSPLVEGAWDGVKDATGWVADKLEGIGIGSASMSGPVQSALPRSGVGFRSYSAPQKQFGTSAVIGELQESSAVWAARGGTSINIGDISNRGGGDMAGHDSHERGQQVDVRPFRHDGTNRPTDWRSSSYDRDQTRSYVEMMKHRNPGMTVLFNDPLLIREGLTQPYSGHDNHLHLTFPNEDLRRPGSAIPDTFPVTPAGFVDTPAMQAQREWDAKIQSLRSGTWTPLPPEELGFSNLPASNKTGVGAERDEGPVAQSSLNTFREWDGETANSLIAEPSSQTRHKEGAASLSTKASDQAEERHPPHSVSVEGTSIMVGEEGTPWTEFENAGGELREVYDRVAQRLGSQDDARIDTEIDRQLRAQFETAPDLAQRMIADSRARHGRTETYDTEQLAEQVAALRMSDPSKAAEVQREILESLPGENRKAQFTDELRRVEGYSEAADQRLASLGVAQTGEGRRLPLESQLVVRTADRLLDEATYSISGGRSRPGVDRLFHDRTDIAALTYSIEALAETDPILARAIRADLAGRLSPADRADLNRMLAGDLDFGEGVG